MAQMLCKAIVKVDGGPEGQAIQSERDEVREAAKDCKICLREGTVQLRESDDC